MQHMFYSLSKVLQSYISLGFTLTKEKYVTYTNQCDFFHKISDGYKQKQLISNDQVILFGLATLFDETTLVIVIFNYVSYTIMVSWYPWGSIMKPIKSKIINNCLPLSAFEASYIRHSHLTEPPKTTICNSLLNTIDMLHDDNCSL